MNHERDIEIVEQFATLGQSIKSLVEQNAEDKRMLYRIIIILIIAFFLATASVVGGFLWYLNQYEVIEYTYDQITDGGGQNSFIGGDGDINNGETDSKSQNP